MQNAECRTMRNVRRQQMTKDDGFGAKKRHETTKHDGDDELIHMATEQYYDFFSL